VINIENDEIKTDMPAEALEGNKEEHIFPTNNTELFKFIGVKIPIDTYKQLTALAFKKDCSKSKLIKEALMCFLLVEENELV
jgi:hypothetical protein